MSAANWDETGEPQMELDPEAKQIPLETEFAEEPIRETVDSGDTRKIETVGEGIDAWHDYLLAKEDRTMVMRDELNPDAYAMTIPHTHRWSPEYRKKTLAKLIHAQDWAHDVWGDEVPSTMLTLTVPHRDDSGDLRPPADALSDLKEAWGCARKVLQKELSQSQMKTEWLRVVEPHKSGYPHIHVAVFGIARPSLGEKIKELWVDRYVEGAEWEAQDVSVSKSRGVDLKSPASYLMKYLGKTVAREESESVEGPIERLPTVSGFHRFSALMWATNTRTWSMSEGLRSIVSMRMDLDNGDAFGDDDDDDDDGDEMEFEWVLAGTVDGVEGGFWKGQDAKDLISEASDSERAVMLDRLNSDDDEGRYPELDDARRPSRRRPPG